MKYLHKFWIILKETRPLISDQKNKPALVTYCSNLYPQYVISFCLSVWLASICFFCSVSNSQRYNVLLNRVTAIFQPSLFSYGVHRSLVSNPRQQMKSVKRLNLMKIHVNHLSLWGKKCFGAVYFPHFFSFVDLYAKICSVFTFVHVITSFQFLCNF